MKSFRCVLTKKHMYLPVLDVRSILDYLQNMPFYKYCIQKYICIFTDFMEIFIYICQEKKLNIK